MGFLNSAAAGALSGFVATAPMTAAMALLHRQLPGDEQHPLPPQQITGELLRQMGAQHKARERHQLLTWVSHFGFGTCAGLLYAPLGKWVKAPAALKGTAFGLMVWATSYLGLLPATNLHQPRQQPLRTHALMVVAHLIWGASLGCLMEHWGDPHSGE